jgi:hypothetical protein
VLPSTQIFSGMVVVTLLIRQAPRGMRTRASGCFRKRAMNRSAPP